MRTSPSREPVLLFSVFVVAVAGLVYELIAGTLTTYLLGSSVTAFSLVIGLFLSAMGLGAWLAQFITRDLIGAFVRAELALAAVGGSSALVLFWSYTALSGEGYTVLLALSCLVCGALVGVEIPLLLRIVQERVDLRVAASHVLALDYAGALLGSLAFPLLLLPHLGLVRSSALLGLLNVLVAALTARSLGLRRPGLRAATLIIGGALLAILLTGGRTTSWLEDQLYSDPVIFSKTTPYQRIVLTRWRDDTRLFIEGHLQLSSTDEHRYHEALIHPALAAAAHGAPRRVLVLGGGDGMAAREVLKHPSVEQIDLVDLDPAMTALAATHPLLARLNEGALSDPRVTVHNDDALEFLEHTRATWDVIVMDLPDPNDAGLSRLYSVGAFRLAGARLAADGVLVTQATSPYYAPDAFWCIVRTVEAALPDRTISPYHALVPSFGEWGFVLASQEPLADLVEGIPRRFLTPATYRGMFDFPLDMAPRPVEVNRLADAILARYYRDNWARIQTP